MTHKTAVWLVPDLIEGSGGHRTILQYAHAMAAANWHVTLLLEAATESRRESPAELIERLFGYSFDDVRRGWKEIPDADACFATIWYSARRVRDLPGHVMKFYLVQDLESTFMPTSSASIAAENSYGYGLNTLTVGNWLSVRLANDWKAKTRALPFTADLDVYRSLDIPRDLLSVCFVHQPEKPRRCAEIGLQALEIVKHHRPDTHIYLFGSNRRASAGFAHDNLGMLDLDACNALYNRTSVGLCISATNPSRIPFEMMAAGLPVVDVWRENNLFDLPEDAVSLAAQYPEAIAKAVIELLDDASRRQAMSEAAIAYMSTRPTRLTHDAFLAAIDTFQHAATSQPCYHRAPVTDDGLALRVAGVGDRDPVNWQTSLRARLPAPIARLLVRLKRTLIS